MKKLNKISHQSEPTEIRHRPPTVISQMYSGPIPPGEELLKYEKACPGAADRIIAMAERQSAHRQSQEHRVIGSNILGERLGSIFSLAITFVLVGSGVYLIMNNKSTVGLVSLLTGPFAQTLVYYLSRRKVPQQVKEKEKEISAEE